MNPLKKGPEIKLPPLKVPGFLEDVYFDLRERHLLPLAILLIIALIAVPFLLADSSDSETGSPGVAGASADAEAATAGALVAEATPGLRDYRRRLDAEAAQDPFSQLYGESDAPAESTDTGTDTSVTESTESTESTEFEITPPSEIEPNSDQANRLTYYSYAIDARVTGPGENAEPTVRRNLPQLTMLPSREVPAVMYMGSTKDGKKALMLISSDVEATFGDGKCVLGSQTCQLLAMEVGLPQTFVYGGSEKTFKIELLKISLVESDKVNKAPLGKPKKGGKRERLQQFNAPAGVRAAP